MGKSKLFTYVVRRTARDDRGAFTADRAAETIARRPRKEVEARARELSRTHPDQLVTTLRGPVVLFMILNSRIVTTTELVADAAARFDERPVTCAMCPAEITVGELCAACAVSNDPFPEMADR